MKDIWVIELTVELNLDNVMSQDFDTVIWEKVLFHSDEIKNIFSVKSNRDLFTPLEFRIKKIIKKSYKEPPEFEILVNGNLKNKSEKELKNLKYETRTDDCRILYEVGGNGLILDLISIYNNEYTVNEVFKRLYKPAEFNFLMDFFDQVDKNSKLITFCDDSPAAFIILFSEESLQEIIKAIDAH